MSEATQGIVARLPDAMLALVAAHAGQYTGRGVDTEGRIFLADFELTSIAAGRSMSCRFRAQALESSEVYHDETGIIGFGVDGPLVLMASSNHYRNVFPRTLVRVETLEPASEDPVGALPPSDRGKVLVFAYNDPANRSVFRDEIKLALYDDGRLGHHYAWGLAGGEFAPRSQVVMTDVAKLHDERPVFMRHYTQLSDGDTSHYQGSDELLGIGAPVGKRLGLERVGVHVELLKSGRRTSYPHAESTEEELVVVIAGYPEVWIDGYIYRLRPGDVVGFPPGTGIAHTFINNAPEPAQLIVVGERRPNDNKVWYPLNGEVTARIGERAWVPTKTELGPHDGLPDARRKA